MPLKYSTVEWEWV